MSRERDSQRSKVYAAENDAFGRIYGKPEFDTVEECQAYLDKLTGTAWFRRHYGKHYRVTIRSGAGYRRAVSYGTASGGIELPRWARKRWVIIHELAHNVSKSSYGHQIAGHGWEFAKVYLDLVTHYLGKEDGARLKAAFRTKKVRFTQPRQRKPLTPEQAAAAAERLAAAREARAAKRAAQPGLVWTQTVKDPKGWRGLRDHTVVEWYLIEIQAGGTEVVYDRRKTYWIETARTQAKKLVEGMARKNPTSTFLVVIEGEVLASEREEVSGYGYYNNYVKYHPREEWQGRWSDGEVVALQDSLEVPCPS